MSLSNPNYINELIAIMENNWRIEESPAKKINGLTVWIDTDRNMKHGPRIKVFPSDEKPPSGAHFIVALYTLQMVNPTTAPMDYITHLEQLISFISTRTAVHEAMLNVGLATNCGLTPGVLVKALKPIVKTWRRNGKDNYANDITILQNYASRNGSTYNPIPLDTILNTPLKELIPN